MLLLCKADTSAPASMDIKLWALPLAWLSFQDDHLLIKVDPSGALVDSNKVRGTGIWQYDTLLGLGIAGLSMATLITSVFEALGSSCIEA